MSVTAIYRRLQALAMDQLAFHLMLFDPRDQLPAQTLCVILESSCLCLIQRALGELLIF